MHSNRRFAPLSQSTSSEPVSATRSNEPSSSRRGTNSHDRMTSSTNLNGLQAFTSHSPPSSPRLPQWGQTIEKSVQGMVSTDSSFTSRGYLGSASSIQNATARRTASRRELHLAALSHSKR